MRKNQRHRKEQKTASRRNRQLLNICRVIVNKFSTHFSVEIDGGKKIIFVGVGVSVTRLGNLLDFGKLFKAFGNN